MFISKLISRKRNEKEFNANLTHLIKTIRDKMFKYVIDPHSVECQSFERAFTLTYISRGLYSRRGVCLTELLSNNFRTYKSIDLRRGVHLNRDPYSGRYRTSLTQYIICM